MSQPNPISQPWRVAVTRDEPVDGPLSAALRGHGFVPIACPVLVATGPGDPAALVHAASRLGDYHWVVCASARGVAALQHARAEAWPAGLRTAAVGPVTAGALHAAGVEPPPVLVNDGGADALWTALASADAWPGRRVLVPTTPGGRAVLARQLRAAGANVDEVEAYRMMPRDTDAIASDWRAARPGAVIVASPRVAHLLVAAVGVGALTALHAVVAIGTTTAGALRDLGCACTIASATTFSSAVTALAQRREAEVQA